MMMSTTILLILLVLTSLAVGFMAGAHYAYLLRKVNELYTAIQIGRQEVRRKNTGVVKPGLNAELYREPVDEPDRKSVVIRPKTAKTDEDATQSALASARNRCSDGGLYWIHPNGKYVREVPDVPTAASTTPPAWCSSV